jgi:hypothetical protein
MSLVANGLNITLDIIPIAAQRLPNVDDHVDLDRAIFAGQLRLVALALSGTVAMGKPDDRSHFDPSGRKELRGTLNEVWFNAH